MAKEPFTANPQWAYEEASDNSPGWKAKKDLICQDWGGKLFFNQKGVV